MNKPSGTKKGPLGGTFVAADEAGKKPVVNHAALIPTSCSLLLDLNRDLASSKLRRKRHMDLKNTMFIAGGDLVSFDALRQSPSVRICRKSLLVTLFFSSDFSFPGDGQNISFRVT